MNANSSYILSHITDLELVSIKKINFLGLNLVAILNKCSMQEAWIRKF